MNIVDLEDSKKSNISSFNANVDRCRLISIIQDVDLYILVSRRRNMRFETSAKLGYQYREIEREREREKERERERKRERERERD